jgi:hypothetical protein
MLCNPAAQLCSICCLGNNFCDILPRNLRSDIPTHIHLNAINSCVESPVSAYEKCCSLEGSEFKRCNKDVLGNGGTALENCFSNRVAQKERALGNHCTGSWADPTVGVDAMEKSLCFTGNRTPIPWSYSRYPNHYNGLITNVQNNFQERKTNMWWWYHKSKDVTISGVDN